MRRVGRSRKQTTEVINSARLLCPATSRHKRSETELEQSSAAQAGSYSSLLALCQAPHRAEPATADLLKTAAGWCPNLTNQDTTSSGSSACCEVRFYIVRLSTGQAPRNDRIQTKG